MPELPEVETIRRQLEDTLKGKKVIDVVVKDKRIVKGIDASSFKLKVKGNLFQEILRRGKVLIVKLKDKLYLVFHLRISGWIIVSRQEEKFSRVIFKFSDGSFLNFCDSRALGEVRLVNDWQKLPIIKEMGPEPFDLKPGQFLSLFKEKKTKIKPLLMDQKFLAGVGNVYAQEALFCAGIHPERRTDRISEGEYKKLFQCLISILKKAIEKKGSSVDTYRQIDGKEGGFVPFLKVYQREGKPCIKCKTPIKRKMIGGRGTYFCPHCQI